eukprot:UN23755
MSRSKSSMQKKLTASTIDERRKQSIMTMTDEEICYKQSEDDQGRKWQNTIRSDINGSQKGDKIRKETESETLKHLKQLKNVYRHHTRHVISRLVEDFKLDPSWEDIIMKRASKVSDYIRFLHDDFPDIRHYVKVKRIAGGNRSDTKLIRGVVIRKNVADR